MAWEYNQKKMRRRSSSLSPMAKMQASNLSYWSYWCSRPAFIDSRQVLKPDCVQRNRNPWPSVLKDEIKMIIVGELVESFDNLFVDLETHGHEWYFRLEMDSFLPTSFFFNFSCWLSTFQRICTSQKKFVQPIHYLYRMRNVLLCIIKKQDDRKHSKEPAIGEAIDIVTANRMRCVWSALSIVSNRKENDEK